MKPIVPAASANASYLLQGEAFGDVRLFAAALRFPVSRPPLISCIQNRKPEMVNDQSAANSRTSPKAPHGRENHAALVLPAGELFRKLLVSIRCEE